MHSQSHAETRQHHRPCYVHEPHTHATQRKHAQMHGSMMHIRNKKQINMQAIPTVFWQRSPVYPEEHVQLNTVSVNVSIVNAPKCIAASHLPSLDIEKMAPSD